MRGARRMYEPALDWALGHRRAVVGGAVGLVLLAGLGATRLGSEFIPQLDEGDVALHALRIPGTSLSQAIAMQTSLEERLERFPEVDRVFSKIGTADVATDPVPPSVADTFLIMKPRDQWRPGMTREKLIAELDAKVSMPGVTNIWTQPIINRIEMLATGIRSQVGIKIFGNDLDTLEETARQIAAVVKDVPGAADVYPERIGGAPYIDIDIDRTAAARYGIDVATIQDVIEKGIGETNLTVTIEGRRRFPIRVRYSPEFRSSPVAIGQIPITSPSGGAIPLSQLTDIRNLEGPSMIQSENGLLRGTVLLNIRGRDIGSFVEEAKDAIRDKVEMPAGYYITWSGQYENQERARQRLLIVVPIVLLIIFATLYITYHSFLEAAHILLAVPFALTGGFYLLWMLQYNFSVAVWVGFIALFGAAVQTTIVMVVYLEEAVKRKADELGQLDRESLLEAVTEGALLRLRPKVMTVMTIVVGLLPIMWSSGAGSEVMRPLATPVFGGMVSSLLHVLIVTPVIFYWLRERELKQNEDL